MIAIAINAGLLIWVATSYRKLKHDVLVALLFGTVKAALIIAFSLNAAAQIGWATVIVVALVRGLFAFGCCWGFMALMSRTDRIELEHRRATASGEQRKKPVLALEWVGIGITGLLCLFF